MKEGDAVMNLASRLLGSILLAACAAPALAQAASYPAAAVGDVRATAYEEPADTKPAVPLPPRTTEQADSNKRAGGIQSVVQVVGSLAAVLGVFFLIVWMLRRASPQRAGVLPAEAFEVLGRAPLGNHQQVQLLRCGERLLLVAVGGTGTNAATTLTEISEPAEVDQLISLCRQSKAAPRPGGFKQVLREVEGRRG